MTRIEAEQVDGNLSVHYDPRARTVRLSHEVYSETSVAFQLITLPVEFNASRRALAILSNGFLTQNELKDTRKVLNAAALTYVAAATVALAELLRFVLMFISSKSRDD